MPTPVREQIMAALESVLVRIGGVTVERDRPDEFPAVHLLALNVLDGGQRADHSVHGQTRYTMQVTVEGCVRSSDTETTGSELTAPYAKVAKLCGPKQRLPKTLEPDGLVVSTHETALSVELQRAGQEEFHAGFALEIEVDCITAAGDPYALGPE
jgi:hypothetical protein